MKTAVVLLNLGGPDSPEAVQPFLENLFNDPDIFKLPFQRQLAKFISTKRAPKIIKQYELIGGKSPIGMWTEIQRKKLENYIRLRKSYNTDVFVAMRYWKPLTQEVTPLVENGNYEKIIMLPLYPHYSVSTTGSSFNEWKRYYKGDKSKIIYIDNYYENPLYIKALNQRIDEGLKNFTDEEIKEVQLVFSAHGTPVSYVKKGDPYSGQIKKTIEAVMNERDYDYPHHLCFQSKVGPAKWLEPSTSSKIEELASEEKKYLLIIPISFVSDHVETLFELNIEYRHVADAAGIKKYVVIQGLNDSDIFVEALYKVIENKL
ncbi:MAG TPA: ferrochelatase [Ignavibacteriaceae bacterium]|nr:ferrochelatase [Ignavibacteriaceae bacterium]